MIRKGIIVVLTLLTLAALWMRLISFTIFLAGILSLVASGRHPRVRRAFRLTGLVLSVMLLTFWVASMRYTFGYIGSSAGVYFESGAYSVFATHGQIPASGNVGVGRSRWPVFWWFSCPAMLPLTPVWMPLVAALIPTGLLCSRSRRFPPGHCQKCGYNLTGNVSGVCPECGERVRATASMKTDVGLDEP